MPRRNDIAKILVIGSGLALFLDLSCSVLTADVVVQQRIKHADACGFIEDPDGVGVGGATVTALDGDKTLASTTSRTDGSYRFSESVDTPMELRVEARGFVHAENQVGSLRAKNSGTCKHPIYVVLAVGMGFSTMTTRKPVLPKLKP